MDRWYNPSTMSKDSKKSSDLARSERRFLLQIGLGLALILLGAIGLGYTLAVCVVLQNETCGWTDWRAWLSVFFLVCGIILVDADFEERGRTLAEKKMTDEEIAKTANDFEF